MIIHINYGKFIDICPLFFAVPTFPLPAFVEADMRRGGWQPHLKWDLGFETLSPVDWVDQAGDYGAP